MHSYTKNKKFSGEVNWVLLALNVPKHTKNGVKFENFHDGTPP